MSTALYLRPGDGGLGGGVFPYIGHIGMCRPHRIGFLRHFGLKTGIHLAHFGLELGMVFKGTTIYSFNS